MNKFIIYCDGSCDVTTKAGGWAYLMYHDDFPEDMFHDSKPSNGDTTNNRMELLAAINALDVLPPDSNAEVYTDSRYVIDGITIWIKNWEKKDFKKVKNVDLWLELDKRNKQHNVTWNWVKGHSGDQFNDFVDQLAGEAMKEGKGKQK